MEAYRAKPEGSELHAALRRGKASRRQARTAAGNCQDRLAKNERSTYIGHIYLARMPGFKGEVISYPLTEVDPAPWEHLRLQPA